MHLGFGSLRLTLRFQAIRSLEAKGKVLGGIGLEVLVLGFKVWWTRPAWFWRFVAFGSDVVGLGDHGVCTLDGLRGHEGLGSTALVLGPNET